MRGGESPQPADIRLARRPFVFVDGVPAREHHGIFSQAELAPINAHPQAVADDRFEVDRLRAGFTGAGAGGSFFLGS